MDPYAIVTTTVNNDFNTVITAQRLLDVDENKLMLLLFHNYFDVTTSRISSGISLGSYSDSMIEQLNSLVSGIHERVYT